MAKRVGLKLLLLCFSVLFLSANEDFITKDEYASQLYNNPRGISCALCHGENGEGKLIARYTKKGEKREFKAPKISDLPYLQFKNALNGRYLGMPRYFLTDAEIKLLYYYLHNMESEK